MIVSLSSNSVNDTFCNTISLSYACNKKFLYNVENFTNENNVTCIINLLQNPKMKEECGDAPGFNDV